MGRRFLRGSAIALVGVSIVRAQVTAGAAGGVPLSDFILDRTTGSRAGFSRVESAPRRYTVGVFGEVRLRGAFGLEAGAFYKRFGFDSASAGGFFGGPVVNVTSSTTGNSWEFPVVGKLHLRFLPEVNGFIGLGPTVRRLSRIRETGERTVRPLFPPGPETLTAYETDSPPGMDRRTAFGVALSGGLEFRTGRLLLVPGIRLTRWDSERTSSGSSASRIARTQVDALLGIGYVAGGGRGESARLPCCVEAGVLAGVPVLAASEVAPNLFAFTSVDTPTRRFAAGAYLEWWFHPRLSLEGRFLARRFGYTETYTASGFTSSQSLTGFAWEAPLLLKWRAARIGPANLIVGGGPALRRASNIDWTTTSGGATFPLDGSNFARSAAGFVATGGIEFRAGHARLRSELCYMRFERPLFDLATVRARQGSLYLLLSIGFAGRRR
jgi:hypothetical protein